jgi:choline dehydrogenase
VLRVVIRDGRAVGVEYRRRGRLQQVFADREIVVSAGALGTPKLLQLSGVGPADHLRSVGVTVLVDSPRIGLSDVTNPKWLVQWLLRRRGKLANSGVEAVAHIRSAAELERAIFS